jgi:hypothetical protein
MRTPPEAFRPIRRGGADMLGCCACESTAPAGGKREFPDSVRCPPAAYFIPAFASASRSTLSSRTPWKYELIFPSLPITTSVGMASAW